MRVFDAHCDALYKMWLNPNLSFSTSDFLHVDLQSLKVGHVNVQCFAIYVPENVRSESRFSVVLEMVDIFFEKVLKLNPLLKFVRNREDILKLKKGEIGAVLTLEGCDAIERDIVKLKTLLRLGISSVGLTWNYSNAVADGVLEERGAGLTDFGRNVIRENNQQKIWTDVSHLSTSSFWDTIEEAEYVIASHSNAYSLCENPRNLTDEQIRTLIKKDGVIGVTFVPKFLTRNKKTTISDVIKHIDYICSLGGEMNVGLGSDFDGISETVVGLESAAYYDTLINELYNYYSAAQVDRICWGNFVNHFPK